MGFPGPRDGRGPPRYPTGASPGSLQEIHILHVRAWPAAATFPAFTAGRTGVEDGQASRPNRRDVRMHGRTYGLLGVLGLLAFAAPALADDTSELRAELEAMRKRVEAQDRRMKELEGTRLSQDEVSVAVASYLDSNPNKAFLVGGGGADGSAGFPMQKKPFIKEGPNEVRFVFRNQVRYEWFHYSDDAVGILASPANTFSDAAPRDRSGFEIERLYFGIEGSLFCPEITYNL